MDVLEITVGKLADLTIPAMDTGYDNICRDVTVDTSNSSPGMVEVTMTECVRWDEFDLCPWEDATGDQVIAAMTAIHSRYQASSVTHDDEGTISIEWTVDVPESATLGFALDRLYYAECGIVEFHNNSNGAYGATGNVRREVREAVRRCEP